MAQNPKSQAGQLSHSLLSFSETRPSETGPSDGEPARVPPQGGAVEPKPFAYGAPPRFVKYGVAVKVLADPVARNSFSQPYSGQRRFWGR